MVTQGLMLILSKLGILLDVDPDSKREGDRSTLYNYSLSVDQDLNPQWR